jgi:hypothetical protein
VLEMLGWIFASWGFSLVSIVSHQSWDGWRHGVTIV